MNAQRSEEQQLLVESIEHYLSREYSFDRRRAALESKGPDLDRHHWRQFAELGWLALPIPQSRGGLEQPFESAMAVMEGIGRHLVLEPYANGILETISLLNALGSEGQCAQAMPAIAAGESLVVPAHGEPGMGYRWDAVRTTVEPVEGGVLLRGAKQGVAWGGSADVWLVSAREKDSGSEGVSLWWVDASSPGVRVVRYCGGDDTPMADLSFDGVQLPVSKRLGPAGGAQAAITDALALATAAACMEAVGALDRLYALTLDYAKIRKQFGRSIGQFQSIQHKLVDMYTTIELSRSMAVVATAHAQICATDRHYVLSAAKAQISASCRMVAEQAVQLHGGIGMTDECSASHYFRRLFVLEKRLGDRHFHLGVLSEGIAAGDLTLYA